MFDKKFPYGYEEVIYHKESSPDFYWDLKENKFFVGFQVMDYNSISLDTNEYLFPLFRLLKYEWKNGVLISTSNYIPTMKCNYTDSTVLEKINHLKLENYFCPNFTGVENAKMGGDYDSETSYVLNFELSMCNADRSICNDIKKTSQFLDNNMVFINTIYSDITYEKSNIEKPFTTKLELKFGFVNTLKSLWEEIYFAKFELDDDVGYILSDIEKIQGFGKVKYDSFSDIRSPPSQEIINRNNFAFYSCNIHHAVTQYNFKRWFEKIPDVLAKSLGVIEAIKLFFFFSYQFYVKYKMGIYLFNNLVILYKNDQENIDNRTKFLNIFNVNKKDKKDNNNIIDEIKLDNNNIIDENLDTENKNIKSNNDKKDVYGKNLIFFQHNIMKKIEMGMNSLNENSHSEKKELNNNLVPEKNKSKKEIVNNDNINENEKKLEEKKSVIKYMMDKFINNYKIGKLSFFEFICRNNKQKYNILFERYIGKIKKKLDLLHYLRMDRRTRLLENLLFTEMQKYLANFLSKKLFYEELDEKISISKSKKIKTENEEIFDYLLECESLDPFERKLIENFIIED